MAGHHRTCTDHHIITNHNRRKHDRTATYQYTLSSSDMSAEGRIGRDMREGANLSIMVYNCTMIHDNAHSNLCHRAYHGSSCNETAACKVAKRRNHSCGMQDGH